MINYVDYGVRLLISIGIMLLPLFVLVGVIITQLAKVARKQEIILRRLGVDTGDASAPSSSGADTSPDDYSDTDMGGI